MTPAWEGPEERGLSEADPGPHPLAWGNGPGGCRWYCSSDSLPNSSGHFILLTPVNISQTISPNNFGLILEPGSYYLPFHRIIFPDFCSILNQSEMGKLAPHLFAYVKKSCLEMCLRIRTGNEHKREHQPIADLPEEKGLDNLQFACFAVASFTNGCTHTFCLFPLFPLF